MIQKNDNKPIRNIEVLLIEPGKIPATVVIPNTLDAVEAVIGGPAQLGCFVPQMVLLISREDMSGLVPNRCLPGRKEVINGKFVLCSFPEYGCSLEALTPELKEEFFKVFEKPEEFMVVDNEIYADPDDVADKVYSLWEAMQDGDTIVMTKWGGQGRKEAV